MKTKRELARFKSEQEEREYWQRQDSADSVDWSKAQRAVFPNLKPSTTAISIRLPDSMLAQIKLAANKRDVPYQSLIKVWLSERLEAAASAPRIHQRD